MPFASNLIGQNTTILPGFWTKDARPPYKPTERQPEVGSMNYLTIIGKSSLPYKSAITNTHTLYGWLDSTIQPGGWAERGGGGTRL